MKKYVVLVAGICGIILLQNCSNSKKLNKEKKVTVVSFSKDVLPIMQASCTPCHFTPNTKHVQLDNFDATKKNIADIMFRVKLPQTDNKFMPFKNKKPALTDSTINVLAEWQKQNMPQ